MRINQKLGYKQTLKIEKEITTNLRKKCERCGHSIIFDNPKIDRILCTYCHYYVYKDDETKQRYRDEERKREFRNSLRKMCSTFLVKNANEVTFGEACDLADQDLAHELNIDKQQFYIRDYDDR